MNIYLLDIPTGDGWRQRRLERQNREAQKIKSLEGQLNELRAKVNAKQQEISVLEGEIFRKEAMLKEFAPKEYKKYQQKLQELGLASNNLNEDENAVNLATTAAGSTTASIGVNTASMPGTNDNTTSSFGSFVMICTALFLCATSALFYGKKVN